MAPIQPAAPSKTRNARELYGDFVDPKVHTIPVTESIIRDIMPFFPKSARVISGYLSEEQLYWKVNYHWEVLLEAVEHCAGLQISATEQTTLMRLKKALEANPPDPKTGYRKSKVPGEPKDKSSHQVILERHTVVSKAKRDLKSIVEDAGIFSKTKRDPKALMLAYAPVAKPAKGKHSTGYALDIMGNNTVIANVARSLGASLVFNEGSHVHCEWKNGVDTTGEAGSNSIARERRRTRMQIDGQIVRPRHCLLHML